MGAAARLRGAGGADGARRRGLAAGRRRGLRASLASRCRSFSAPASGAGPSGPVPISTYTAGLDDLRRRHRAGVRGLAAGGGVRAGGLRGGRRRRRLRARSRRSTQGESYIEDVPSEALRAVARAHPRDHPLRATGEGRRGAGVRADAADRQPRAGPRTAGRSHAGAGGACCRPTSWWCSSRPPIPAPRASGSHRCWSESGLAAGRDFHLAFSPERVDPGRTDFTLRNTPKVVGGLTDAVRASARRSSTASSAITSCACRAPRRPS